MTGEKQTAIARSFNDAFAAMPFEDLRTALVESENFDQAREQLGDHPIGQFVLDHVDPHVQIEVEFPGAEILTGQDGIEGWWRFWRDWLEPWDDLRPTPSNYTAESNHVFVDMKVEAEGGLSGAAVELDVCQVWSFEGDKVVGYSIYPDRPKAMAIKYEGG